MGLRPGVGAADRVEVDAVVIEPAQPTSDVLPQGVRRRWSRADARLPAILAGELLAGVLLGMAWQVASTLPPVTLPPPSVIATTTGSVTVPMPVTAPAAAPPPPPRTEPRNPFAAQLG